MHSVSEFTHSFSFTPSSELYNGNAILKKVENQTVAGPQSFSYCQSQCGQRLFGYPHSSKYLLTDVNVCGAVQFIDTAAPELQLIECVLSHDTTIFLQNQIVETFLSAGQMCHKQDFIVVPPPSNLMEVKENTYHRGKNRTLIKHKSK